MQPVIAISGTPGTGKTVVGHLLAMRLGAELLEIGQIVQEQNFHIGKDSDRETFIADIKKLQDYLLQECHEAQKQKIVIGHFADIVPEALLELLIVLRCNPVTLTHRLRERSWSTKKILENIQAEILGECTAQGLSHHGPDKIFEIDTSEITSEETVTAIEAVLAGKGDQYAVGKISWLRTLNPQLIHQIMEEGTLPSEPQKA